MGTFINKQPPTTWYYVYDCGNRNGRLSWLHLAHFQLAIKEKWCHQKNLMLLFSKQPPLINQGTVISAIMPPPLDEKRGIIADKVFPLFSENFFGAYFGLVMYIWELIDVTEKVAFQM